MGHNGEAAPLVCVLAYEVSVLIGLLCVYKLKPFTDPLYNKNNPSHKEDGIFLVIIYLPIGNNKTTQQAESRS